MPLIGIGFYQLLLQVWPSMAPQAMWLPMLISAIGAAWFVLLNAEHSKRPAVDQSAK
jgi:hypothetical protein